MSLILEHTVQGKQGRREKYGICVCVHEIIMFVCAVGVLLLEVATLWC